VKKILSEILKVFCLVIFCFVLTSELVLADCSTGWWIFGTNIPNGNYHCNGSVLQKCTNDSFQYLNDCRDGGFSGSGYGGYGACVNTDDKSAYCEAGFIDYGGGGDRGDPSLKTPVGYTKNYSSSLYTSGMNYIAVSNGGWHQEGSSNPCVNNNNSLARDIDCPYLENQSGSCIWDSVNKQCYKKPPPPDCICGNSSGTCSGILFNDSCGISRCPGSMDCSVAQPVCSNTSACSNLGGTCGSPYREGTKHTGICPGDASCVCIVPLPYCYNTAACTQMGGTCGDPNRSGAKYTGLCPGGSDCTCVTPCVPSCAAAGNYCNTQTFSNGCSGTCTGSVNPANNDSGTCGTADTSGSIFSDPPTTNLCADGDTPSAVSSTANSYLWTCTGTVSPCTNPNLTVDCSGIRDNAPVFSTFSIKNVSNVPVVADAGRNHICELSFANSTSPNTARFVVTFIDAQGGADVSQIQLKIGAQTFTDSAPVVSGNSATATFDIPMASVNSRQLENLTVVASDVNAFAGSTVTTDTGRDFKYWDCKVPITGTGYDGSSTGADCSAGSFSTNTNFPTYSLKMNNVDTGNASDDRVMTVSTPNYSSDSSNHLVWGSKYLFTLSNFEGNINGCTFKTNKAPTCSGQQFTVDNSVADPYVSSVSTIIDFSSVLNQDPWWQAIGGGVISNNKINSRVPVTCADCKMSVNGFVSAPTVSNAGGKSVDNAQVSYYQASSAKLVDINKNYAYFYDQYFVKNGIGTTLIGDKTIADITGTGVYFVNGNLTIDSNKDINISNGEFLMIIVKGDITVTQDVDKIDGILVANNINAGGISSNQLNFYGSIFAADTVNLSRGYNSKVTNNSTPAVKVNYSPELLFKLPGSVAKVLTNFRWGN
jgi:hypothetical protein